MVGKLHVHNWENKFAPDELVAAFHKTLDTILSMGTVYKRTRRGQASISHRKQSDELTNKWWRFIAWKEWEQATKGTKLPTGKKPDCWVPIWRLPEALKRNTNLKASKHAQ